MTKNFETVFVTIVNPRNGDCGVVEEGRYRIEGDLIVLVDIHGNKRRDAKGRLIQKRLVPGESPRKVAARTHSRARSQSQRGLLTAK